MTDIPPKREILLEHLIAVADTLCALDPTPRHSDLAEQLRDLRDGDTTQDSPRATQLAAVMDCILDSSLGSPTAQAVRGQTDPATVAEVLTRSDAVQQRRDARHSHQPSTPAPVRPTRRAASSHVLPPAATGSADSAATGEATDAMPGDAAVVGAGGGYPDDRHPASSLLSGRDLTYHLALTYSGDQRGYVQAVVQECEGLGLRITQLADGARARWDTAGVDERPEADSVRALFVVVFVSVEYLREPIAPSAFRTALWRDVQRGGGFVLPVVIDGAPPPITVAPTVAVHAVRGGTPRPAALARALNTTVLTSMLGQPRSPTSLREFARDYTEPVALANQNTVATQAARQGETSAPTTARIDPATYQLVLGDELRRLRKEHGWHRKEIRERLDGDISLQTIAAIELGIRRCSVVELEELCRALEVLPHTVLTRVHDRIFSDERTRHLRVDLVQVANDTPPELLSLRRWAAVRLRQSSAGTSTEVRLDWSALEYMSQLCGIDPVELVGRLRAMSKTV